MMTKTFASPPPTRVVDGDEEALRDENMIENRGRLVDEVRHALDEAFSENIGGLEAMAAICKACRNCDSKLYLCATGKAGGADDDKEWLYDVTCLDYDAEYFLRQTVLAAQCEWGPQEEIYGDFEKLLVAQAAVRVMVFDGTYPAGYEEVFEAFAEYISRYRHTHDAGSWLFSARTRDGFLYCRR